MVRKSVSVQFMNIQSAYKLGSIMTCFDEMCAHDGHDWNRQRWTNESRHKHRFTQMRDRGIDQKKVIEKTETDKRSDRDSEKTHIYIYISLSQI